MPNQLVYESRTNGRKKSPKNSMMVSLLALLVIFAGALWAYWQSGHEEKLGQQSKLLLHDAEQLWKWSDSGMKSGAAAAQWSVRWDLTAGPQQVRELADTLFRNAAGEPLEKRVENNGGLIKGRLDEFGSELTIYSQAQNEQRGALMVLYRSQEGAIANQTALLDLLTHISRELSAIDDSFTSSMKAHGYTASSNAIKAFAVQSQSEEVDRYEDGGTVSATMYTRLLQHMVKTRDGVRANVQVATHQLKGERAQLLTIGIPFINGDYTAAPID